ncbi:MAG: keratin [Symplocastrum torsivum CPER-KK1]|jgi:hypothetical protein|uniref:Keratin n=1 Tax=Symplocastrum torsivum CPER-KK1 TaxID=450513 RepID=A0A951PHP4_9CYAN|nr:keratin [Symplocastrum torsivum CPER-KK1]
MVSDPILSTLAQLISLHEGIAEPDGEQVLNVLLATNIAKALDLPEEVTLTTRADIPESHFVTYHSTLLNKFSELLSDRGCVAAVGVKYDSYLKTTGFEKLLQQNIVPQNGLIRFLEAKPETTRYIWCNVAYTAEADERRIGMVSFIINELTGVTPIDIGDALFWEADRIDVNDSPDLITKPFEELSSLIEQTAAKLIKAELENWSAKLTRTLTRDSERLHAYYGTIATEIASRIEYKGLIGEEKEKELARIEATQRELERKLADIKERYTLVVDAFLHSAMVIHLPTVHINCELVRKKAKRTVTAVWNPFTKILEPLRCELGGEPVYEFYLDDRTAKIISPSCWNK